MGFFTICAGVVLLQLSKSAKDVPDSAVFAGDLDQMRTIAEQEQPETEPKADAIRGAAAIVRRFSQTRQKKEAEEFQRLHDEKLKDLATIGEEEQFEWDGLRRRRTVTVNSMPSIRSRHITTPFPAFEAPQTPALQTPRSPRAHPPLGMSSFPVESDSDEESRPATGVSLFTRAKSIIGSKRVSSVQSPMHPLPLTEISIPSYKLDPEGSGYYGHGSQGQDHIYGLPAGLKDYKTEYESAAGETDRHVRILDEPRPMSKGSSLTVGPTPPPHSARRQFSFQNVFRKGSHGAHNEEENSQPRSPPARKGLSARKGSHGSVVKGATEEERLGLVKGDTHTGRQPVVPVYADDDDEEEDDSGYSLDGKMPLRQSPDHSPSRDLTPPRKQTKDKEIEVGSMSPQQQYYEQQRRRFQANNPNETTGRPLPPPPEGEEPSGSGNAKRGAFL